MYTLAEKYRPTTIHEIVGQTKLKNILLKMIEQQHPLSLIFYGEPGSGKTTIARLFAKAFNCKTHDFNAVTGNKKTLDTIFEDLKYFDRVIVIIDEIHRLNKDKQDLLLPHIESGKLILLGATTSNPLFAINPAIRSRTHLMKVEKSEIHEIVTRLEEIIKHEFPTLTFEEQVLHTIANHVNGDIRYAINIVEMLSLQCDKVVTYSFLTQFIALPYLSTDKNGDGHYDLISAFQKSIRGSDVDAALYYLAALIESNDHDAIYRRLIVCAYEDIGLANPSLVSRTALVIEQVKQLGLHEGRILLSNIVIELCLSPKSKSGEHAIDKAIATLKSNGLIIPDYLKQTPTRLQNNYKDAHPQTWRYIQYLPDKLKHHQFYFPGNNAHENMLKNNYTQLKNNRTSNIDLLNQQLNKK